MGRSILLGLSGVHQMRHMSGVGYRTARQRHRYGFRHRLGLHRTVRGVRAADQRVTNYSAASNSSMSSGAQTARKLARFIAVMLWPLLPVVFSCCRSTTGSPCLQCWRISSACGLRELALFFCAGRNVVRSFYYGKR